MLGLSVLGATVLQSLPMWSPIKVYKTVKCKVWGLSLCRSWRRGEGGRGGVVFMLSLSPVMKITSQLAVSSLLSIRHIFPWDIAKTISHCQSDDVCNCIYALSWDLIHLQVWIQNISWSWTADLIQSGKGVGMSAHLSCEVDVHIGLCASSFLVQPMWKFGYVPGAVVSKYFSFL